MIDLDEIWIICIRSVIAIIVLLITTKIMGKKQISQLTVYDYVVGITIGSIAADTIITLDEHFINGMVAVLIFTFIAYCLSVISAKNRKVNELLNGKSSILMENGEFNYENLKKTKIPIYKFIEQARLKGYYDLNVLDFAILETNGEISFLPKEEYQTSTPIDFKSDIKKGTKQTYSEELVVEGKINYDKLESLGKNESWLKKELKKMNVNSPKNVLLVTIDEKDKLNVFNELK